MEEQGNYAFHVNRRLSTSIIKAVLFAGPGLFPRRTERNHKHDLDEACKDERLAPVKFQRKY